MDGSVVQTWMSDILHVITQGLLVPDILLLVLFIGYALFCIGSIIVEFVTERRHFNVAIPKFLAALMAAEEDDIPAVIEDSGLLKRQKLALLTVYDYRMLPGDALIALIKRLVNEEEARYDRISGRNNMAARVSPMLGLMGTLIPLGPGIQALGEANTELLSASLLIAFDTTVAGLVVAAVCMVVGKIRSIWYSNYMSALDSAMATMLEKIEAMRAEGKITIKEPSDYSFMFEQTSSNGLEPGSLNRDKKKDGDKKDDKKDDKTFAAATSTSTSASTGSAASSLAAAPVTAVASSTAAASASTEPEASASTAAPASIESLASSVAVPMSTASSWGVSPSSSTATVSSASGIASSTGASASTGATGYEYSFGQSAQATQMTQPSQTAQTVQPAQTTQTAQVAQVTQPAQTAQSSDDEAEGKFGRHAAASKTSVPTPDVASVESAQGGYSATASAIPTEFTAASQQTGYSMPYTGQQSSDYRSNDAAFSVSSLDRFTGIATHPTAEYASGYVTTTNPGATGAIAIGLDALTSMHAQAQSLVDASSQSAQGSFAPASSSTFASNSNAAAQAKSATEAAAASGQSDDSASTDKYARGAHASGWYRPQLRSDGDSSANGFDGTEWR